MRNNTGQCPLREGSHDPDLQPRLCRLGGDVRRSGHGNRTPGSSPPSFGGGDHNRPQLPAEGAHGTDPRPCQDQQVTDPAATTEKKGAAQIRQGRLKSHEITGPFFARGWCTFQSTIWFIFKSLLTTGSPALVIPKGGTVRRSAMFPGWLPGCRRDNGSVMSPFGTGSVNWASAPMNWVAVTGRVSVPAGCASWSPIIRHRMRMTPVNAQLKTCQGYRLKLYHFQSGTCGRFATRPMPVVVTANRRMAS